MKNGWYAVSQSGSHIKMKHDKRDGIIIFPNHGSQELGKGLEQKIRKDAGLNRDAMKTNKKIKIIIEKTATGFSAYSEEYPIFTSGKTITELQYHSVEAAKMYFEDQKEQITIENIKFEFDFKQFFQYYNVINASVLAKKIGMNATLLSQYVSGRKNHPKHKPKRYYLEFIKLDKNYPKLI